MNESKIKEILENHKKWVFYGTGERADLSGAYLSDANLRGAYLRGAYLRGAYLSDAYLRGAYLSDAYLRGAYLRGADLRGADLRGAYLRGAYLSDAYLMGADLRGADLMGADLRGAYLSDADLRGADLRGVKTNENTSGYHQLCPEGAFIAWKKLGDNKIAKLLIPQHAKRSNATTLKCRASEAKVLQILTKNNDEWVDVLEGVSTHDLSFIYKVSETVKVDDFDENRWNECSTGIHFFISREVAENY